MKVESALAFAIGIVGLLIANIVGAHPIAFHASGFTAGFAHPLLGLDHVLAMIAVGVWAAQCGGRARLALPASFVAAIAAGGALAMSGAALPHVDAAIAATVLALGLLIALAVRLPIFLGAALAAAFALWHGFAHAAELPTTASPIAYAGGFVLASAMLVAVGEISGRWTIAKPCVARILGASLAAVGLAMLSGG